MKNNNKNSNKNYIKIIKEVVLPNEGVYSYDENDPGGETVYGISKKNFPKWKGWYIVDKLKKENKNIKKLLKNNKNILEYVYDFYKKEFWNKLKLDNIKDYNKQKVIMDTSVNLGVGRTSKLIQKVLNVKVDGIIGPITLKHLDEMNEELFVSKLKIKRIEYYTNLVIKNKKLKKYFYGWIRRTIQL